MLLKSIFSHHYIPRKMVKGYKFLNSLLHPLFFIFSVINSILQRERKRGKKKMDICLLLFSVLLLIPFLWGRVDEFWFQIWCVWGISIAWRRQVFCTTPWFVWCIDCTTHPPLVSVVRNKYFVIGDDIIITCNKFP